ncbi:CD248 molecule, endosialin a [Poeciliopsis prolifica]|uniref:CD248 molecule, endosialin a n=1 Tax=Poeciliopsis prolifica TaxID=188132 RepID=UPI002414503D|nr:CD248 molecule, endosialin a [Poeciliopsis prolifica]
MGFLFFSYAIFLLSSVLYSLFGFSSVLSQDLRERDALCNAEGCFVIYFERKIFLDSWRSCKEKGGNLVTIKRKEEANAIATLFSTVDLRSSRTKVKVWIGLQRQPRQCNANSLRGFSWTTGDQDTEYTNWQTEDSPDMCLVSLCVSFDYDSLQHSDNFKWIHGPCSVPADGYLCHFAYNGMCSPLSSEGSGVVLYTTPFNLLSTTLTHLPVGSVANLQCLTNANQKVQCVQRTNDGSVGWSPEPPFCSNPSISHQLCERDNGGCEHFCTQAGGLISCDCAKGFHLRYDGQTCEPDVCQGAPCESECLPLSDGYRCACPDGYMLAPDEHACLDVDECLQAPCQQRCTNSPGTFECQCLEGYVVNEMGDCEDIDECLDNVCQHACENIPGSYTCHCLLGFSVDREDPTQCLDDDECQIPGMCEQMCVNYVGGFQCFCKDGYELSSDQSTCQKIRNNQVRSTPLPFPHVGQIELGWNPVLSPWSPEPTTDHWPENQEQPLDWLTSPSTVSKPEEMWDTSASQDKPRTSLSAVDDLYENDEQETTTTIPSLPTSTISEGAWNWWPSFSSSTQSLDNPHTASDIKKEAEQEKFSPRDHPQLPGQEAGKEGKNYEEITHSPDPAVPTLKPLPPFLNGGGGDGDNLDSVQDDREHKQSNTGLLVGLLVPICIFIVVMVALSIFYCTHCGVKPRNKNATGTECYHWISGAHDKQGAPGPPGDKATV